MTRGVKEPLYKRIMARIEIDKTTDCWHFTGAKNNVGYGMVKKSKTEGMCTVHKAMYEIHNYCIVPDGMVVLHTCESYDCCNPAHLEMGTRQDVTDLMYKRGKSKFFGSKQNTSYSCVHCGLTSTAGLISRWHNNNCKHKPTSINTLHSGNAYTPI